MVRLIFVPSKPMAKIFWCQIVGAGSEAERQRGLYLVEDERCS
jgi:hypothetical protein